MCGCGARESLCVLVCELEESCVCVFELEIFVCVFCELERVWLCCVCELERVWCVFGCELE